jgi:hypothetical protein
MNRFKLLALALAAGLAAQSHAQAPADAAADASTDAVATKSHRGTPITMVRSAKAEAGNCLAYASAHVTVQPVGAVEVMDVRVEGLPADTDFDFFVIQVPNAPFGLSWYQGDVHTNKHGRGHQRFIGRFNEETFIVAPGAAPAPSVHNNAFPDATINPPTGPVHTFHLGLWFNAPADAVKAGCPGDVTPFNGEHNAGIQVLSTRNSPDAQGPLLNVKP